MKKIIDKRIVNVAIILFVLGVISGVVFLFLTTSLDKLIIKEEINSYLNSFNNNVNFSSLLCSFKYNISYICIITLCSIIYVFCPLVIFINYYKGLLIGFLIASSVLTFKLKGFLYGLLFIFPHHILSSILLIIYSSIMFKISLKLIDATKKGESINLKVFIKKIITLFFIVSFICIIISILEVYVNRHLVNWLT